MGRILGKNIAIYRDVNGTPRVIGLSTSCSVDMQTDMVELASLAKSMRAYRPGKTGVTIQVERLFSTDDSMKLLAMQVAGTPLNYIIEVEGMTLSGRAYISSQSANAPASGYATHTVSLTGTGEVSIDVGYISFADALVAQICAETWGDGVGLTLAEARGIADIGTKFRSNTRITSFSELAQFTGLTRLESYAFYGCTALREVAMPDSVTSLGGRVFEKCSVLDSVTLSSSLTNIGNYMFSQCRALTSVDIPAGVTSIGIESFKTCMGLTSVDIPAGVTSIGSKAFAECSALSSVTVRATIPPTLGADAFYGTNSTLAIYVPSPSSYARATNWSNYADKIRAIPT